MKAFITAKQSLWFRKTMAIFILVAFLTSMVTPAGAELLPAPGTPITLSPAFNPLILKAVKVYPENPFQFEFIVDVGDTRLSDDLLKSESQKLIRYFLASLTTPENDLWVNLSPYEEDRIIPDSFGVTEMGRDLLAQDYLLKQITSTLIYPEGEMGKRFWARVHQQSFKKFGTTQLPFNTFNKVWIVPQKAVVYENGATAYVSETKLKVMLEEDYIALDNASVAASTGEKAKQNSSDPEEKAVDPDDMNELGSQIVREIILPELEKEVNTGTHFAPLRQVYNSLVLANWYKKRMKDSILSQIYNDKNKVAGVEYASSVIATTPVANETTAKTGIASPLLEARNDEKTAARSDGESATSNDANLIYERYVEAFKKGVYNYIRDDYDPGTKRNIARKYFSGGADLIDVDVVSEFRVGQPPGVSAGSSGIIQITTNLDFKQNGQQSAAVASPEAQSVSSAITSLQKSLLAVTAGTMLALAPMATEAVSNETAQVYSDDAKTANRQISVPQAKKIVDVNLTKMLADFKPKYAAQNPDPSATWLKTIVSSSKTFDDFSKQVSEVLQKETNVNKKAAMQKEFLRTFYYFMASNTIYDTPGAKADDKTIVRLSNIIEGNPKYKGAPSTLVCQNASELALILLTLEFGFDKKLVSIPEVIVNFTGQKMRDQGGHVAVLVTLANGEILFFDLTQGIKDQLNINVDHRVILIRDNAGKKMEITLPAETTKRIQALQGLRGDDIDSLLEYKSVEGQISDLFAAQAQQKEATALAQEQERIRGLLKLPTVTNDPLVSKASGLMRRNLESLLTTVTSNTGIAVKNQNNQTLQGGFDAIKGFITELKATEALRAQGKSAEADKSIKMIAQKAQDYLKANQAKFQSITPQDASFTVNKAPIGGEFIIAELKKVIDIGKGSQGSQAGNSQSGTQTGKAPAAAVSNDPNSRTLQDYTSTMNSFSARLNQATQLMNAGQMPQAQQILAALSKDLSQAVTRFDGPLQAITITVTDERNRPLSGKDLVQRLKDFNNDIVGATQFGEYKQLEAQFNGLFPMNSSEAAKIQTLRGIYTQAVEKSRDSKLIPENRERYKKIGVKAKEMLGKIENRTASTAAINVERNDGIISEMLPYQEVIIKYNDVFGDTVIASSAIKLTFPLFNDLNHYVPYTPEESLSFTSARREALMKSAFNEDIFLKIKDSLKGSGVPENQLDNIIGLIRHLVPNSVDAIFERLDRVSDSQERLIAEKESKIELSIGKNTKNGDLDIIISDNGIGIEQKVFEYWQSDAEKELSTKPIGPYFGGSGISIRDMLKSWVKGFDISFVSRQEGETKGQKFVQTRMGIKEISSINRDSVGTDVVITLPREFLVQAGSSSVMPQSRTASASVIEALNSQDVGGINLSADQTNLEIRGNGQAVQFNFDTNQLQNLQFDGLVPVIINITPVINLPLFLSENPNPVPETQLSKIN